MCCLLTTPKVENLTSYHVASEAPISPFASDGCKSVGNFCNGDGYFSDLVFISCLPAEKVMHYTSTPENSLQSVDADRVHFLVKVNLKAVVYRDMPKFPLRCSDSFDTFYNRRFGVIANTNHASVRTMGPDTMLHLPLGASGPIVRVSGCPILIL